MTEVILRVENLCKSYGGVIATDNVSFDVLNGEVHAIIGPNGAGKTTLISQLSGLLKPDSGEMHFRGHNITRMPAPRRARFGLARTFQLTTILREFSVHENVSIAVQANHGSSFRFLGNASKDSDLNDAAQKILRQTGLTDVAGVIAGNLAHGQQRQLELAMALATDPGLLLLARNATRGTRYECCVRAGGSNFSSGVRKNYCNRRPGNHPQESAGTRRLSG